MLKGFTYGNGVTHSLILDDNLLPDVLQDSRDTKNIVKLDYSFDKVGNVTAILDEVQPTYSLTSLVYDDLHRLTSVTGDTAIGNSSIKYDALGNIESYKSKDRNLTYTYNRTTNRLSSVKGAGTNGKYANLGYDTRGNIINNGAYQLNFNLANQLTSAKNNTYLYDGHNRRVKQVEQSGTNYSLYSQDGTLLYREKGDTITGDGVNYIYLGKKLIAKYGDVTPASEADSRQHYRPFGETLGTPKDDVGYTGHKFDKELGLSYMQARYYDPVIGRFYSNDPVDALGHMGRGNPVHGFNRYTYANNNPYKYTDPDGKFVALLFTPPAVAAMQYTATALVGIMGGVAIAEAVNDSSENGPAAPDVETGNEPDPADKSGELSRSGRALQKHGGRKGSAFPPATGKTADKNKQGQGILEDIVNDPEATTSEGNRFGGTDVTASDGRGARFDNEGKFRGFLEPKREEKE
nr:RHS repeat-associated core domain-containing protein [Pseudoalteromonas sp. L23]